MKNEKVFMILSMTVFLLISLVHADVPLPLKDVKASSEVIFDGKRKIYAYNYGVYNPPVNTNQISAFRVDINSSSQDTNLSWDGLVNGDCYIESEGSKYIISQVKMIPVGMDAPPGYMPAEYVGEEGVKVREWSCGPMMNGFASWGSSEESVIKPGQSISGFLLTSYGLPGIRNFIAKPDYIVDEKDIPEEVYENNRLKEYLVSVYESIAYHGKTLGPTAPPADFKPVAFIDYIISLKHEAASLGWIKNQGIVNSLDVKLENAKKAIERNNIRPAKNVLEAFVSEVEAQGCASYEKCPEGKHLTPEAYGLLKYNAEYLLERL